MARPTNQNTKRRGMSYTKFGYIFIAPFVIVYCIFSLYPLLTTFWYSAANMQKTTAAFWGFSDKDVYYDRYLDVTPVLIETDDETGEVVFDGIKEYFGVSQEDYAKIRYFFSIQDQVDINDPFDAERLKSIVKLGPKDGLITKATIDKVQKAVDEKDLSYIDVAAMAELTAWDDQYSNLLTDIQGALGFYNSVLKDQIVEKSSGSEGEDGEEAAEPVSITADDILSNAGFINLPENVSDEKVTNEAQRAFYKYLASKTDYETLEEYFTAAQEDSAMLSDPTFYYIIARLKNPNACYYDAENDMMKDIDKITISFDKDLQNYLIENSWVDIVNSEIPTYAEIDKYIGEGDGDLHDIQDQLMEDVQKLNDYGIINNIKLVMDEEGNFAPSENSKENLVVLLQEYKDKNFYPDQTEIDSHNQIAAMQDYARVRDTEVGAALIADGIKVDKYLTFGEKNLNIDKYREYKKLIKLDQAFTYDKYKEADQKTKDREIEKANATIKEIEPQIPELQKKWEANKPELEAQYDKLDPNNPNDAKLLKQFTKEKYVLRYADTPDDKYGYAAYFKAEDAVTVAHQTIKLPAGIFKSVNAKDQYVMVGFDNFNTIFNRTKTFNDVAGAFVTTAVMWIIGFIPQILLALLLSAWFTDTKLHLKGLNLMKALMYLPNVITAVTVAIFFRRIFSYSTGEATSAAQLVIEMFGGERYNFFQSAWATRLIVCFINFWMWYGNTMIVLIAGITSINESLYESAQIDGANSFQTYTKITMPLLRPILLYTMVTSMIGGLQMFDIPQNLNMNPALITFNGSKIGSITTVLMFINKQAFGKQDLKQVGVASATSILLFIVTTILSILIFYLMRDKDAAKAAKAKKLARKAGA